MKLIAKSIILILLMASFKAEAVVYTTWDANKNGWNYYYSQPMTFKCEEGKVIFKLCIAQKRAEEKLTYFMMYLPSLPQYLEWDTPENAPKNYKKGFIMKIRDGKGEVFDMTVANDKAWEIENITQKVDETLKGSAIFKTFNKIDQIEVVYEISAEDFYKLVDNGFKKIRVETTSPDKYEDFNFTEKQTKESISTIGSHLKNMLKQVEIREKALRKSREELRKNPPAPKQKKEIGEF